MTNEQKSFNSTLAGQRALCEDASRRATVLLLNRKVRSLGGEGMAWCDKMIETANDSTLASIKNDLIDVYNSLVTKQ
jgi:hypothetical protein